MHRHIVIFPRVGNTKIFEFEISNSGTVEIRKRLGKYMSIANIVEVMQGTSPDTPIFVEDGFPEIADVLKMHGHRVVR